MVSREVIEDALTKSVEMVKCTLKDKLASFQRNRDKYVIEDVSLEPVEITQTLTITDEEEIKNMKNIVEDDRLDDNSQRVFYGAIEMHQDQLQKRVNYPLEEFGGVNNFGTNEYKLVNGKIYDTSYYRERKPNGVDDWIDMRINHLDSAIDRSPPMDTDVTLFRYGHFPSGMKVGDTGKFKGYTSTSLQEASAERFKDGFDHDASGRYKIIIRTPKGTKGVLLNDTFETMREHEFLLGRNQKFMVLSVNDETREVEIGLY